MTSSSEIARIMRTDPEVGSALEGGVAVYEQKHGREQLVCVTWPEGPEARRLADKVADVLRRRGYRTRRDRQHGHERVVIR